jgi:oligopeptide/dipeptide ABC transporter ATP-binding protein
LAHSRRRIQFEGGGFAAGERRKIRAIRGNRIAMIFQEPMTSLNPVHTVGRQVAEPLALHKHLAQRDALEQCVSLLAAVNIAEPRLRAGAYPHQFSGGMRQRVMIAMGMGCVPDVIIADEPTTALDVTIQAQLLELLQAQVANHNTALLLITHNLGIVARYAHRVNVMYAGRVVESAHADELYACPKHPYTIGLLRSVPRLDQPMAEASTDRGQPPDRCTAEQLRSHPRCLARPMSREAPPLRRSLPTTPSRAGSMSMHDGHDEALVEIRDWKSTFPSWRACCGESVGAVRAVDGVTLDIRRGETGLVGESAAASQRCSAPSCNDPNRPLAGSVRGQDDHTHRGDAAAAAAKMQMIFGSVQFAEPAHERRNCRADVGARTGDPQRVAREGRGAVPPGAPRSRHDQSLPA